MHLNTPESKKKQKNLVPINAFRGPNCDRFDCPRNRTSFGPLCDIFALLSRASRFVPRTRPARVTFRQQSTSSAAADVTPSILSRTRGRKQRPFGHRRRRVPSCSRSNPGDARFPALWTARQAHTPRSITLGSSPLLPSFPPTAPQDTDENPDDTVLCGRGCRRRYVTILRRTVWCTTTECRGRRCVSASLHGH